MTRQSKQRLEERPRPQQIKTAGRRGLPDAGLFKAGVASTDEILYLQREAGNAAVASVLEKAPQLPKKHAIDRLGTPSGDPAFVKPANDSYASASQYVTDFFLAESWVEDLLVTMARDGFQLFKNYSSKEFNQEDSLLLGLFEIALAVIPAAGPLLGAFKELSTAKRSIQLAERLIEIDKELKEKIEAAEKLKAVGKKVGEVVSPESEAAKGKIEFEISTINSLGDLNTTFVQNRLQTMGQLKARLDTLKNAPTSTNLDYEVRSILGPIPAATGLKEAMQHARDQFELRLYRQFYALSGRARRVIIESYGEKLGEYIDDVPRKVLERVRELNGEWIWAGLRVVKEQRKDYVGHNI